MCKQMGFKFFPVRFRGPIKRFQAIRFVFYKEHPPTGVKAEKEKDKERMRVTKNR